MTDNKGNILIVDDEKSCLKINNIILSDAGYNTTLAKNGLEAWELFQKEEFDLIVLDRMMPVMNGDELTIKIRAIKSSIPIIMLTALAFQKEREEGIKLGVNQYICKANEDFDRELIVWSDNLIKKYKNISKDKAITQSTLKEFKKISDQLGKIKISDFNNEKFISFEMSGAHWDGDYKVLSQLLIESIESLIFPNWPPLKPALLLKVNEQSVRVNVEENSVNDQFLEQAFDNFFIEEENDDDNSVKVIWSVPWETRETGEGISLLINNFPKASEEIDIGFGLEEESDREVIQGTTYRFLDYMAMVIGNFEIQRKFKDLVFSASVQLDRAINEIDMNRQKQIEIFESALMTVEKLEFNANKNPKEMVEDVLNGHFDDFQQLEMNSLNDVQHLLKWIRKLKNQFSDLKEDEQLSDQADADTIGGDQADVEKLLAQFDL
ncbi:MAG: response regulator [Deltaproteobacteria bacterium]|jgi:CheY-like chemotaxis protein|nr:response regulator [Deltaproteobacteria bacterium]MBT4526550.1 response regulator [Deltaproteobacteria bacterium]